MVETGGGGGKAEAERIVGGGYVGEAIDDDLVQLLEGVE